MGKLKEASSDIGPVLVDLLCKTRRDARQGKTMLQDVETITLEGGNVTRKKWKNSLADNEWSKALTQDAG